MIQREVGTFLVVGTLTVLVDFLTYTGLLSSGIEHASIAKTIGFLAGMLFAYFANKHFTFGRVTSNSGNVARFTILYLATLAANVLVNTLVLYLLAGFASALAVSFVFATSCSAALNFIGMKFFVFQRLPTRRGS